MTESPIRFLVATDIHLGHAENHAELGRDSYEAFQEILSIAKSQNVDFLLLGGDLFDEVNPSQKSIFKCLTYLRDSIFGDKMLQIRVKGIVPNFSNVNLNISLPIFTIHGNHDYPSNDFGKISVCDLLHASNYVNYFGKHLNISQQGIKRVCVKPLIFTKSNSSSRLAIYGLGYIKDHKLNKMFQDNEITFQQPDKMDNTFCILVLHQNKYKGKGVGACYQNCIHGQQLPKWMDLVIWGHQHQPIYKVFTDSDVKIFQPGSTVATSYIQDQALKKQCALITIGPNKSYSVDPILLEKSHRPMVIKNFVLTQIDQKFNNQRVNYDQYFDEVLSQTLGELQKTGQNKKKPIIRIRIDYTGHEIIRLIRIQQKYRELVANNNKIFAYIQKKVPKKTLGLEDKDILDMIKKKQIPRHISREAQLTLQLMQIFGEQVSKQPLQFFPVQLLKQTIAQASTPQTKGNVSNLKQFYKQELDRKCLPSMKDINDFTSKSDKEYNRIHQKLLKNSQDSLVGKSDPTFDIGDIKADIDRLRIGYKQKEVQVMAIFANNGSLSLPSQTQTQIVSKSTARLSDVSSQGRGSLQPHKHEQGDSQQQCCVRVEKQQYQQNETRNKFNKAHQMATNRNRISDKGKKSVSFK